MWGIHLVFALLVVASAAPNLKSKMQGIAGALSDLVPDLFAKDGPDKKVFAEKVSRLNDQVADLEVPFDHSPKGVKGDPALKFLAGLFKENVNRAFQSAKDGNVEYSKYVLRSTTAYCIACHTRGKTGADFPLIKSFSAALKDAPWASRMEFYSATRQFGPAMSEVNSHLARGDFDERAIRVALAITIRVKRDPDQAKKLVLKIQNAKGVPEALKKRSQFWLRDIEAWRKESRRSYESDSELMTAARALMERAEEENGRSSGQNDIKFLRATLFTHDLFDRFPDSELVPEALALTGEAYESLMDFGVWNLHQLYYLACIDKAPHTPTAEGCFKKYETSVTLEYAGSRGLEIPSSVKKYMQKLKETASAP